MTHSAPKNQGGLRLAHVANVSMLLLGVAVIAIVANSFAAMPMLRWQMDSTKTRAYSLSEQTRKLLSSLSGDWTVAMVFATGTKDPAMLRQVDEVLKRYVETAPSMRVLRIDPSKPETLGDFEAIIAQLQMAFADDVAKYDRALDEGEHAFAELQLFAQQHARALMQVSQRSTATQEAQALRQFAGVLDLLGQQGDAILQQARAARSVTDSRPIPDYETARSIMAEALWQMSNEVATAVTAFDQMRNNIAIDQSLRQYAVTSRDAYEAISQKLLSAADPLRRLPTLELSRIGQVLSKGDAALILGPPGATVIPSEQLFPLLSRGDPQRDSDRAVTFDQRFRGEQMISSAIRALLVGDMPTVVFVHAESSTLLKIRDEQRQDVVGVATVLEANRYKVREWIVGSGDQPKFAPGHRTVWVVVPTAPQRSIRPIGTESQLIDAVVSLIEQGESVMLNLYPSLLHRLGQKDEWQAAAARLGVEVDTSRVVLDRIRTSENQLQVVQWQAIHEYEAGHIIAEAVNGQQTTLHFPMRVTPANDSLRSGSVHVLATIQPMDNRWLEDDLMGYNADAPIEQHEQFADPIPVIAAIERSNPARTGFQRAIVVGSGGWMISNVADRAVPVAGQNVALVNPGNLELMLSGVAWLGRLDDMIAPSPLTRQVSRLRGMDSRARLKWGGAIVGGLPAGCLVMGTLMWFWRRR